MGFTSVLVFNNDRLNDNFDKPLRVIHHGAKVPGDRYSDRVSSYYGVQGVEKPWEAHADSYCLMMVGGYTAKVLCTTVDGTRTGPSNTEAIELDLLKQLAEKHGFTLHKKPVSVDYHKPGMDKVEILGRFNSIKQAEKFIHTTLHRKDPQGVDAGYYGVNASERMLNPRKKKG